MFDQKMRICFLGDAQSIHLQKRAKAMHNFGHEIHIVTFQPTVLNYAQVHPIITLTKHAKLKYLLGARKVKKIVGQIKPDIVDAQYATSYGLLGALTRFHPLVVTAWGSDILISSRQSKFYRVIVKYALKRADAIVAVADHLADEIAGMGISRAKIKVFCVGCDLDLFPTGSMRETKKESVQVASTRRLASECNVALLIRALQNVRRKVAGLQVVIAGEGPEKESLTKLVNELNLTQLVSFVGQLTQPQLAELLAKTDIYVSCSISDGASESLLDAMVSGAFPVVTDIPANRLWLTDGQTGFLSRMDPEDVADKIIEAARSVELRLKAAKTNLEKVKQNGNLRVNMRFLEELYKKLLGITDQLVKSKDSSRGNR